MRWSSSLNIIVSSNEITQTLAQLFFRISQNQQQQQQNGQNQQQQQQTDQTQQQNSDNNQNHQSPHDTNQNHNSNQQVTGNPTGEEGEIFNMTEYLGNLQLNPPEEVKAAPLDPETIEVSWKIPTNLRRDKLRFQESFKIIHL